MDIRLPGHSGIDAKRRLEEFCPDVPVVMLTMFEDPPLILRAIVAEVDTRANRTDAAELRQTRAEAGRVKVPEERRQFRPRKVSADREGDTDCCSWSGQRPADYRIGAARLNRSAATALPTQLPWSRPRSIADRK